MSKHDELTTSEIVAQAMKQWEAISGVARDQSSFRLGDWDVRQMNEALDRALELDPEGTTAYLLLECFFREYLEGFGG